MASAYRFVALGSGMVLAGSLVAGGAAAAPPRQSVPTAIALVDSPGFAAVSEHVVGGNRVVDTFASRDATVRVIGRPGGTASITLAHATKTTPGGVEVRLGAAHPKTDAETHAYADSGRSVVGDLVALGVSRDEAERTFGDMETADGHNPYVDAQGNLIRHKAIASTRSGLPAQRVSPTVTVSNTIPFDVLCTDINAFGGKVTGRGCSTFFLVAKSGFDWWLNTKYKLSVRSTDTSWLPVRLILAAWDIRWADGNVVYDWDPSSSVPVGACKTVTVSVSDKGGISLTTTICPNKLDVWTLSRTKSGAAWTGQEEGTSTENVIGVQAVHSPPGAPATYWSTLGLACTSC